MKVRMPHAPYIANKIALDLVKCNYVSVKSGVEMILKYVQELIQKDIQKEEALEERVFELIEENDDEIEFLRVDRREMFWLIKKKLAKENNFVLSYEDRYNELSHEILETLWKKDIIDYEVSENRIKNVIYNSIEMYIKSFEDIETRVLEKISHYKRKIIPGSEEYDLVFERLYEEELRKKGMLL